MQLLPWFESTASKFLKQKKHLAHAWLLTGARGIGKFELGQFLAASLLCEQPNELGLACGRCRACGWVENNAHPDLKYIYPAAMHEQLFTGLEPADKEDKSQEIRIEQLRALDDWFYASTHRAGFRVVIFYPAHQINGITANALLKILEEPMPQTVFLLITDQLPLMLPTIRSRCQLMRLQSPAEDEALKWLQAQDVSQAEQWLAANDGAPFEALKAAQNDERPIPEWLQELVIALEQRQLAAVYTLLATLEPIPYEAVLTVLQRLLLDIQYCQFGLKPQHFAQLQPYLAQLASRSTRHAVTVLLKNLTQNQKTAQHPFNQKLRVHRLLDLLYGALA